MDTSFKSIDFYNKQLSPSSTSRSFSPQYTPNLILQYIDNFGVDIEIPNPKNVDEKIKLNILMQTIYNLLITDKQYIFDEENADESVINDETETISYVNTSKLHKEVINSLDPFLKADPSLYKNKNIFIKQYCFINKDINIDVYIQNFIIILREICLHYYAFYLNSIRPITEEEHKIGQKLTIVPKIYKIELTTKNSDYTCINIFMEYLEKEIIPEERATEILSFDFWDLIIKANFSFFESNGLFHLDTAHRNVFFTLSEGKLNLAIIDYGESDLIGLVSSLPQPSGYLKTTSDSNFFYKYWLKNKALSQFSNQTSKYFDDPDDPEFKKTMNDYIFGGVINKHIFKKGKSKKTKSKKSIKKSRKSKKSKKV